jgi:hypothetical protein
MGADVVGEVDRLGSEVAGLFEGQKVIVAPGYPCDPSEWRLEPENEAPSYFPTGTFGLDLAKAGRIQAAVDAVLPLRAAREAHERIERIERSEVREAGPPSGEIARSPLEDTPGVTRLVDRRGEVMGIHKGTCCHARCCREALRSTPRSSRSALGYN